MSGISGGGFSVNSIMDTVGKSTSSTEQALASHQANMDPGSSQDLIKLQNLSQQWGLAVNLQSTLIKTLGDALKGIVQKVG